MVVDDVENDAEAERMGPIDKTAEVVGSAIEPGRREEIDAVVTPTEAARKVGDRHDLEHGNPQLGQAGNCSIAAAQFPSFVNVPMCIS